MATTILSSPTIRIRRAQAADQERVWAIIEDARRLLKADGSDQWQAGYPDAATVHQDIANGHAIVVLVNDEIAGTISLNPTGDPHYRQLVRGSWFQPEGAFATVHRLAVDQQFRGQQLAHRLMEAVIAEGRRLGIPSLRLATHPQNDRIHRLVQSVGFTCRGMVMTSPTDQRAAYELVL